MLQSELPPATPGGVGHQVALLADALSQRGHDVTVFVTHEPPTGKTFRCVRVPLRGQGRLYRQFGVGLAFAGLDLADFDVVHAHGDDWLMGRRPRVRTFYGTALLEARSATSWLRRCSQFLYYPLEWLSSWGAVGVTISGHTRRYLPLVRETIPCGFDPCVFFPDGTRSQDPSILFVAGTLAGRKRGDLLLRTFQEVRRTIPSAHLTIVSRDQVSIPHVTCLSDVKGPALGEVYRSHWLLCSTSSYEGFGVPYIEAMASGLPVVATSNPGARELLHNGALGAICAPEVLGPTLVELLSDEKLRDELSQRALMAAQNYTIDRIATQYERLYEHLEDTGNNEF